MVAGRLTFDRRGGVVRGLLAAAVIPVMLHLAATITSAEIDGFHGRRGQIFRILGAGGTRLLFLAGSLFAAYAAYVWFRRARNREAALQITESGIVHARFYGRPRAVAWADVGLISVTNMDPFGLIKILQLSAGRDFPSHRFNLQGVEGGGAAIEQWVAEANAAAPAGGPARH